MLKLMLIFDQSRFLLLKIKIRMQFQKIVIKNDNKISHRSLVLFVNDFMIGFPQTKITLFIFSDIQNGLRNNSKLEEFIESSQLMGSRM